MPAEPRLDGTRRGWFHFSLWQLFAVMTALCIYFAYQMSVVRGREQLLKQLREKHYYLFVTTADEYRTRRGIKLSEAATVPIVRRWLGDQAIQSIGYFEDSLNADEVRTLQRNFPESDLQEQQRPNEPCHPGCFPHGTLVEPQQAPVESKSWPSVMKSSASPKRDNVYCSQSLRFFGPTIKS